MGLTARSDAVGTKMHEWVARRHWGRWYVALTAASAIVYMLLPAGSFYASNVSLESSWIAPRREALRNELRADINAALAANSESTRAIPVDSLPGKYSIPVSGVVSVFELDELKVSSDAIITLSVRAQVQVKPTDVALADGFKMTDVPAFRLALDFDAPSTRLFRSVRPGNALIPIAVTDDDSFAKAIISYSFNGRVAVGDSGPTGRASLVVPDRIYAHAIALIAIYRGEPKYAPGSWWRMLYLSVSTVTTLGFGDIVPLSTGARILVTSEASLGVLFAGLFISKLASAVVGAAKSARRSRRRRHQMRQMRLFDRDDMDSRKMSACSPTHRSAILGSDSGDEAAVERYDHSARTPAS